MKFRKVKCARAIIGMAKAMELEFENQAFVELLSEDGLIILARYNT